MDKDSIAAEYALGGLSNNLFVSRYISYIPNKGQLIAQIEAVLNEWNKVEKRTTKEKTGCPANLRKIVVICISLCYYPTIT